VEKQIYINKPKGQMIKTQDKLPEYEPPKIITYTEKEILEQIGPAQACSPSPCLTTL